MQEGAYDANVGSRKEPTVPGQKEQAWKLEEDALVIWIMDGPNKLICLDA